MWRIKVWLIIGCLFWVGWHGGEVYGKTAQGHKYSQKQPVLLRSYPVYLELDRFQVHFITNVRYDLLQFLYQNGKYYARAEVEVFVKNKDSEESISKIWTLNVQREEGDGKKTRRRFYFSSDSLLLKAGKYSVLLKYRDLNSQRHYELKQTLDLAAPGHLYAAPPLYFRPEVFPKSDSAFSYHVFSGMLSHWDFNQDLGIFSRIWRKEQRQPVQVKLKLVHIKNQQTVFAKDTVLRRAVLYQNFLTKIPVHLLEEGKYSLEMSCRVSEQTVEHKQALNVVWFNRPFSLRNVELAIQPLRYVLDKGEFEALKKSDHHTRNLKFKAWWKKKDPTPKTPYNELKNEFYKRVDSTIVKFSIRGKSGWKTDLGRIYIINGPPDQIEDRRLAPIPQPFIRWIYGEGDKRRVYTFSAIKGGKEFVLKGAEK